MVFHIDTLEDIDQYIPSLISDKLENDINFVSANLEALWKRFLTFFQQISAAGGLVRNTHDEYLWIRRLGIWDLPKGKVEKNETTELAAIREVEEECGIHNLILGKFIAKTYHTYPMNGNIVLKTTYWYSMFYEGHEKLLPQTEEDITEVIWVKKPDLQKLLNNTYRSIKDLFETITQ